jgi:hypothetical protein
MLNSATHPRTVRLAKKIFHEIAGFVNDRGAMERVFEDKELAERRKFAAEEGGEGAVRAEFDAEPLGPGTMGARPDGED